MNSTRKKSYLSNSSSDGIRSLSNHRYGRRGNGPGASSRGEVEYDSRRRGGRHHRGGRDSSRSRSLRYEGRFGHFNGSRGAVGGGGAGGGMGRYDEHGPNGDCYYRSRRSSRSRKRTRKSTSKNRKNRRHERNRDTKSRSRSRSRSSSFLSKSSRSYSAPTQRSMSYGKRSRYSWSPSTRSRDKRNFKSRRYSLTRCRNRSRSRSRSRSYSWRHRHELKRRHGRRRYQREMNANEYVAAAAVDMGQQMYGVVSDDENLQRRNRSGDGMIDDGKKGRMRWSRSRERKRDPKRRHGHRSRRRKGEGRKDREYSQRDWRSRSSISYGSGGSVSSLDRDDSYGHFEGGAGAVIHGRYKIIKDVGLGTFGRVVQAIDLKRHPDGNIDRLMDRKQKVNVEDTVAIKIVRDVKRYHESAIIEADILKDVNRRGGRGQSLCAVLLNQFDMKGHFCLVFECLGRSLYDFMKTHGFKPFPLYCVRDFARQLLKALEFIHSFGLIHTDLKPENILLKSNKERQYRLPDGSDQQVPASTSIKLIDFGGATYDHEKKSTIINTRQYRSPEVILGLGWSMPSDMWSAGCIIAELYKGDLLFATHDNFEHLALIERVVGRFPFDMVSRSKEFGTSTFDSYGWHRLDLSPSSKSYVRKTKPLELVVKNEDRDSGLLELLQSLLTIEPCKRSTASEALANTSLFSARWS